MLWIIKESSKNEQKIRNFLTNSPKRGRVKGKVTTYKILANKLRTKAYRAVGNAMNKNPYAPFVPGHRVVNSNGKIGGFAFGIKKKIFMLKKEGIKIKK